MLLCYSSLRPMVLYMHLGSSCTTLQTKGGWNQNNGMNRPKAQIPKFERGWDAGPIGVQGYTSYILPSRSLAPYRNKHIKRENQINHCHYSPPAPLPPVTNSVSISNTKYPSFLLNTRTLVAVNLVLEVVPTVMVDRDIFAVAVT